MKKSVVLIWFLVFGFLMTAGDLLVLKTPSPAYAQKKVDLYMTSWCGYCRKMIGFMKKQGIEFEAHDIEKDSSAYKAFKNYGGQGVPVIVVGDQVVYGYDPDGVLAALE